MFNIIKTPGNYFTHELLHYSNVAFHCKKLLAAILGGKLFGEVFCRPTTAPMQLPRSTQPGRPFLGRCNEYQSKGSDALQLGSKGRYGSCVGGR